MALYDDNVIERFHSKWKAALGSECWEWSAGLFSNGYGQFYHDGIARGSHRVSWEIHNNRGIPDGFHVCHTCDNRKCVNPSHLVCRTPQWNAEDAFLKGRRKGKSGAEHPNSKLSPEAIPLIRILARYGATHQQTADRFGISRQHVTDIISERRWA